MNDQRSPSRSRIALVGAGRIGRQHAQAVQQSDLLELTAVVDPDARAREAVGDESTLRFESPDALPELGLDGVIVAVPTAHHVAVVSPLLDARIPVLCEKPCGLDVAEVLELAALARKVSVPLMVGYWRRFVPSLCALQARIQSGETGDLTTVLAFQWDGEPPSPAFRDPASSGGILVDMGVHEFDMLRWLTGQEIYDITGFASHVTWADVVEGDPDTVNLVAYLTGGSTAIVSLARRHPPGDLARVEVLGGDRAESLTFIDPASDVAVMLPALQAQAEALVGHSPFSPASVDDAVEALHAATRAATAVGLDARREVPR
jgi:myo-inositol 2-dehydrogenase/D-chiro-inositol 1-dehydrogenase